MPGTAHGKVDCFLGSSPAKDVSYSIFKGLYDLLNSLTSSGKVTRIAYNVGLSGSGTDYWDEANPFGNNAWYCYRFNTSSVRNWEWYMFVQHASGSGNFGDSPGNPGLLNGVAEAQSSTEGSVGIAIATMTDVSGVSISPWNGTTNNDGTDLKGDPVWNTSSIDDILYVLPRSNDNGGLHSTSKENTAKLYNSTTNGYFTRFHLLCDDDGLAIFIDSINDQQYACSYFGYFEPRTELTNSIKTPLVMINSVGGTSDNIISPNETFGSVNGNDIQWEGGVTGRSGSYIGKIARYDIGWQVNTTLNPNLQLDPPAFDIFSVPVLCFESPYYGHVGYIVSDIYQEIYNTDSHNVNSDSSRVVFGDSTTTAASKIYTVWTGSIPNPGAGTSRTGSQF